MLRKHRYVDPQDGRVSTLYDSDFLQWTEQQTELLRRRAAGELPNDEGLDWLNLAEEIESVGASGKSVRASRAYVSTF